ncbi:hypothetical protein GLYMA_09G208901v4 [Glycine max]|nr:hypothetical protein GLYMA_09G208901v4 [Glycine max]
MLILLYWWYVPVVHCHEKGLHCRTSYICFYRISSVYQFIHQH